jgi:hypothetical protein
MALSDTDALSKVPGASLINVPRTSGTEMQ